MRPNKKVEHTYTTREHSVAKFGWYIPDGTWGATEDVYNGEEYEEAMKNVIAEISTNVC